MISMTQNSMKIVLKMPNGKLRVSIHHHTVCGENWVLLCFLLQTLFYFDFLKTYSSTLAIAKVDEPK